MSCPAGLKGVFNGASQPNDCMEPASARRFLIQAYNFYGSTPFCSGYTTLTSASGTFTDGSPQGEVYKKRTHCSWLIAPGYAGINITFTRFETERSYDFVSISEEGWGELGRYHGHYDKPFSVVSPGKELLVTFHSDYSRGDLGFEAHYQAVAGAIYTPAAPPAVSPSVIVVKGSNSNTMYMKVVAGVFIAMSIIGVVAFLGPKIFSSFAGKEAPRRAVRYTEL